MFRPALFLFLLIKSNCLVPHTHRHRHSFPRGATDVCIDTGGFAAGDGGIMFKDEIVGEGKSVSKGDELEVHYKGWFYAPGSDSGIKFDDSRQRDNKHGLLFEYDISPVINGWKFGLKTMKEGGKRTILIPPSLGYGDKAAHSNGRPSIPANSELRFEIELITVNNDPIRKFRRTLYNFLFPYGRNL